MIAGLNPDPGRVYTHAHDAKLITHIHRAGHDIEELRNIIKIFQLPMGPAFNADGTLKYTLRTAAMIDNHKIFHILNPCF